eukprot:TRINITY_DN7000_c0_g1_i1.p1 TRINITY_DN7000_c0_g1~~TRINITY_DN7000_c0_g1_i1.p1  ORF type:complete len:372 (+),score=110.45 TRINITY_DN7000_c0_g1_i1:47-1162(+)
MNKIARFSLSTLGRPRLDLQPRLALPLVQRYYSDDSGEDKKVVNDKLAALLKGLKTTDSARKSPDREVKLAKPGFNKPIKRGKDGKPKREQVSAGLDEDVIDATKSVARLARNENKKKRTESDLLKKLMSVSKDANNAKEENEVAGESAEPQSLSSLFSDIKIERPQPKKVERREALDNRHKSDRKDLTMEQLAFLQKREKMRREERVKTQVLGSVDLFSGNPMGIFTGPMEESSDQNMLVTWRACQQRELRILSTPSPRNALEEMVLLTKQGKLWNFPVDNEQGLDYSNDPFYKHVFLEHHLEPWCPKMGPVRHFMEVVCLGLSKNPYVSSQKKLETILWFKDYFERPENNEILVHSGFWEDSSEEALSA